MHPSASLGHAGRAREITSTASSPGFACLVHAARERATVVARGELDIETVPVLDGDICALRDLGFETIVVDLRELTFIDSQGIQLFVRWSAAAARRGQTFRLIPGPDRVQFAFRITGLLETLGFETSGRAA